MARNGKIATALLSDTGRIRQNNEDAVGEDADLGLLVLADGMGGYNAGEVASGIAVDTLITHVREHWEQAATDTARHDDLGWPAKLLRTGIELGNRTIQQVAQTQPQCAGMGTTIVACVLYDDVVSVAHVGDSRLYRLRDGRLEQLTRDHSLVEELIARGRYSREEALQLARKNIVTRALGVQPDVQVDLMEEPVSTGDILLLCSDGLTDMLADEMIAHTLRESTHDLPQAARHLIKQANEQGGRDNISVVLARIDASFARGRRWYERLMEWF